MSTQLPTVHHEGQGEPHLYASCIIPLLDALGHRTDERTLKAALPPDPAAMGETEFLNSFANLGYESIQMKSRLAAINSRLWPCLFHSKQGNVYILLKHIGSKAFIYHAVKQQYAEIPLTRESGTVTFFHMMDEKTPNLSGPHDDWFFQVLTRFKRIFIWIGITSMILTLLALISPLFVMMIYKQLLMVGPSGGLRGIIPGVLVFLIGFIIFRYLRSFLQSYISIRLGYLVNIQVLRRIMALPITMTMRSSLASQINRIRDFESVADFFASGAFVALVELPLLIILFVGLGVIAGPLVFVPLAAFAFLFCFGLIVMPLLRRAIDERAALQKLKDDFTHEMLANFESIKNSGIASVWCERFRQASSEASVAAMAPIRLTALIDAVSYGTVMFAGLATIGWGAVRALDNQLQVAALMTSTLIVWRILAPLRSGFNVATQYVNINKSIRQLNRFMALPLETESHSLAGITHKLKGAIAFAAVSHRHSNDAAPTLLAISLQIAAHETVVLKGHPGSGRSCVLKLILGFHQPGAGRILLDGVNIKEIKAGDLRQQISYLPDHPVLFNTSILENITMAAAGLTRQEIEELAAKLDLNREIMKLPQGWDTVYSEKSEDLFSLTFRKRLCILRTLAKRAPLLLLDEPSAYLEAEHVAHVIEILKSLKDQTTIIIADSDARFEALADRTLHFEKGQLKHTMPARQHFEPAFN
jgi:ATP-binding cassette subfamily C protein/ATP-binding cassette subfamily C protein LapB